MREIPQYKDTINTPFKTNEQRKNNEIEKNEMINRNNNYQKIADAKNPPNTLLKLEINEPKLPKLTDEILPPYIFGQNPYFPTQIINPNPFNYPHGGPMYSPMTNYPYIIKKNIINLNPVTDFTRAANVYEDILPNNLVISDNTYSTLSERKNISDYIRGIFIKTGDGEEILMNKLDNINKTSSHNLKNLLSHIKLLDINPYHFNRLTDNPYKTMPLNFCMYRSCYPIKMNEYNYINCAKTNIGMNVRIYGITNSDDINNRNNNKFESDIWRELEYYKYIKGDVINNNSSPNFIQMYAYYRAKNIGINFNQFTYLREFMSNINFNNKLTLQNEYRNKFIEMLYGTNINTIKNELLNCGMITQNDMSLSINSIYNKLSQNQMQKLLGNYDDMTNDNIIILSEAPNQNIINWASKSYGLNNTPVKKMIQSGYHSDNEWESILFQLLITQIILFKKKIAFKEFSLEHNVFIKDLQSEPGTNIGYWKYNINNIEYNVPNYGYLLLIDSSYKDLENNNNNNLYKIYCEQWGDNLNEIINMSFTNMLKIFNFNNFNNNFVSNGGQKPSDNIMKLMDELIDEIKSIKNDYLNNIGNHDPNTLYSECLKSLYKIPINIITTLNKFNYLHNRIGTIVLPNEKNMLINSRDAGVRNINVGELISINTNDIFIYSVYINDINNNECLILSTQNVILNLTDKKNFTIKRINKNDIYYVIGNIDESYEVNKNNSRIETYYI